eukprot:Nitzschia sp. Nitz4//scaffold22_size323478//37231//38673//NITZ4_000500-RA/size323478-processed-gene-0.442-mRNA-1//-1//CDS//3329542914//4071//frame0
MNRGVPIPTEEPDDDDDIVHIPRDSSSQDGDDDDDNDALDAALQDRRMALDYPDNDDEEDDEDQPSGLDDLEGRAGLIRGASQDAWGSEEFSVMTTDTSGDYLRGDSPRRGRQQRFSDPFLDEDENERMCSSSAFRCFVLVIALVLVIAIAAILLPGIRNHSDTLEVLRTNARLPVQYECPSAASCDTSDLPGSYKDNMMDYYQNPDKQPSTTNITLFEQTFRTSSYDDWGKTYEQVKAGMFHFKSTYYPPYLQDGSTIFEAACGIGLNLYMTLEILQESAGLEQLVVYGNDIVPSSIDQANLIWESIPPAYGHKGIFCPTDMHNLDYVPSNAFDLVYCGYISPLEDPLEFNMATASAYQRYGELCKSDPETDWAKAKLNEIAEQRQNDWYGEWVAEMARIAKPGVPVIVEQVSPKYCNATFDWGGVHRDFWVQAATNDTYGWNVDPESIVIEDDSIFRDRYHVFMLKKGVHHTETGSGR